MKNFSDSAPIAIGRSVMQAFTRHSLPFAAFMFVLLLMPTPGRALTSNCPAEPTQTTIVPGEVYYGTNCNLYTDGDIDRFTSTLTKGYTYQIVLGLNGSVASNICVELIDPNFNVVAGPSCTGVGIGGGSATGFTYVPTLSGIYTIDVSEESSGAQNYALSLFQIYPFPSYATPIPKLGESLPGDITPITDANQFTLNPTATTGEYLWTVTLTGNISNNVCFWVYLSNGTAASGSPQCTGVGIGGSGTVQIEVDKPQAGGNMAVVEAADNDGTQTYSLEVSCLVGTCPQPGPTLTPNPATGPNQTFTITWSAPGTESYTDLTWAHVLINSSLSIVNGCYVRYYQPTNSLYLDTDNGEKVVGPLTPGSSGTISNSQCTVNGSGSMVSGSGSTLTLTLSLSAKPTFVGAKDIYLLAVDSKGVNSGWQNKGTWTPAPDTPPSVGTLTSNPSPATSIDETFTATFISNNGRNYTDLTWSYLLVNSSLNGANACFVLYYQPTNSLYLDNDNASGVIGPLTPGSSGTLSNSQCTVNGTGSSAAGSGDTLTLNLSVTAKSGFTGAENIYLIAIDSEGSNSSWHNRGTWTP